VCSWVDEWVDGVKAILGITYFNQKELTSTASTTNLSSHRLWQGNVCNPDRKFLVTKIEFGGIFGMSLEGACHEVEVTPNLELLFTFGMSL
jgi:hypothetical protein